MTLSSIGAIKIEEKSGSAFTQFSKDSDNFLKLLVAQIQNQDPLKPMDSTEFVSQTATLTQVEQTIQMNNQIEGIRKQFSMSAALADTGLLGKDATVNANSVTLNEAPVTISYSLSDENTQIALVIKDAQGKTIKTINGAPTEEGRIHDIVWHGDTDAGLPAPAGQYSIELASDELNGTYETFKTGKVTSVEFIGGESMIRLSDGSLVPSDQIVRAKV